MNLEDWKSLTALAEDHKSDSWIFRGVEDETYQLIPRIGRPDTSKDLNTGNDLGYAPEHETRSMSALRERPDRT